MEEGEEDETLFFFLLIPMIQLAITIRINPMNSRQTETHSSGQSSTSRCVDREEGGLKRWKKEEQAGGPITCPRGFVPVYSVSHLLYQRNPLFAGD